MMKDKLNQADCLELRKKMPRWRKTAQHARLDLIKQGLMKKETNGLWEITPAGIVQLKAKPNQG